MTLSLREAAATWVNLVTKRDRALGEEAAAHVDSVLDRLPESPKSPPVTFSKPPACAMCGREGHADVVIARSHSTGEPTVVAHRECLELGVEG